MDDSTKRPHETKFSFYVSSDINVQVQICIEQLIGRIPSYKDLDLAPGGVIRPSSLYVSAILCDEFDVLGVASQTQFEDADEHGCHWDSYLKFSPKYCDLLPSAQIAITVYEIRERESNPTIIGGTTFPLFSKKGRLKSGQHSLKLWPSQQGSTEYPSSTPAKIPVPQRGHAGRVEHALKQHQRGEFDPVPWLDSISIKAAKDYLSQQRTSHTQDCHRHSDNNSNNAVQGSPIDTNTASKGADASPSSAGQHGAMPLLLVIKTPDFPQPVVYHDAVIPTATTTIITSATTGTSAEPIFPQGTSEAMRTPLPGTSGSGVLSRPAVPPLSDHFGRMFQNSGGRMIILQDPELGKESPAEIKTQKLIRSARRGAIDTGLRPNTSEKERLEAIVALPPGRALNAEDKELLWRFRFALTSDSRALTRFLKCVDWGDAAETAQATGLMDRWAQIAVADALELLSPDFPMEIVRAHAVHALHSTSDDDLLLYLLQLVQALRYEPMDDSPLSAFLLQRSKESAAVASAFFWYLCAELDDPFFGPRAEKVQAALLHQLQQHSLSPHPNPTPYSSSSKHQQPSAPVPVECIPLQLKLLARLRHLADAIRATRTADRKTEAMRALIAPQGACSDMSTFECPCPLDPSTHLMGIVPEECSVFKSKVNPLKVTFYVKDPLLSSSSSSSLWMHDEEAPEGCDSGNNGDDGVLVPKDGGDTLLPDNPPPRLSRSTEGSSPDTSPAGTHIRQDMPKLSLIYKRGDDLRQDQLVLQLISLMDRLLKKEHLDLRIIAYHVLPTSASDGLIEFVPSSMPMSQILRMHGTVQRYLVKHHPDPKGPYGLDPGVLNNYVRSCAGSAVVTHILGVGDRHMDNIMMSSDGKLFHIDFGYFLGRDPKFSTAPMVLSRAMVDGMGGTESHHYKEFVQLCAEAYNILRKSANLLFSLIHLMAGSSIPDIHADPEKAMLKVQERLRLDLNDEEAAALMGEMLTAAQAAVLVRVAEVQHRVAQGWR